MEAVLKKEIIDLGYEISLVEDGRVTFLGDDGGHLPRQCIFLRTAERVLLKVGSFRAETFEELFQGTKATAVGGIYPTGWHVSGWLRLLPSRANSSARPISSRIMKKAMVERMKPGLRRQPVIPETGSRLSGAGIFVQRSW